MFTALTCCAILTMSKELLILRHAKSDWHTTATDFDRPLNKRGKKAAKRIGRWLNAEPIVPDVIVSSPARRALKTAKKVCAACDYDFERVIQDERIYQADVSALLQVLADCPKNATRILLIGHNPGLEELLMYLVNSVPLANDGKLLATATLARLSIPDELQQLDKNCARLLSLTRAASLSE